MCHTIWILILISFISDEEFILRPPHHSNFYPDDNLWEKVANYFKSVVGDTRGQIRNKLPQMMELWGKVCIKNGGDSVRSTMASGKRLNERDSSYVRVCDFNFFNCWPETMKLTDYYSMKSLSRLRTGMEVIWLHTKRSFTANWRRSLYASFPRTTYFEI